MALSLYRQLEKAKSDEDKGHINMQLADHFEVSSLTSEGRGKAKDHYHNAMVCFKRAGNTIDAAACLRRKADIIRGEERMVHLQLPFPKNY